MSFHRSGPPGAVAVSFSTNTLPTPLSSRARYAASGNTTTSGIGSSTNTSKLNTYRSTNNSTYISTSTATSPSYRLPSRKSHKCTPTARSVLSYSDSGSVAAINLPSKYSSTSTSSASSTSSTLSNARERNGYFSSSSLPLGQEFYDKYSPAHYTPKTRSNTSTVNGHRPSYSSSSIGLAELHGGDDSAFRDHRDRSYSSSDTSTSNIGSDRWSTRPIKRRNNPINTVFAGHDEIDGVAAPNEVKYANEIDLELCTTFNGVADDNGNSNDRDVDTLCVNDDNNLNHHDHLTLTNQSRGSITSPSSPLSSPSDPGWTSPDSPASETCNSISSVPLTTTYTSVGGGGATTDHRACSWTKPATNPVNTELLINDNDQEPNVPQGDEINREENLESQGCSFEVACANPIGVCASEFISDTNVEVVKEATSSIKVNGFIDESKDDYKGPNDLLDKNFKLTTRPTGNHGEDTSKPSTSRRTEFFNWDGSLNDDFNASSSSNSSSVPVGVHQAIYRGLNDQIEESSTSRPPRNRSQARRDDSYGLNGLRNIGNTCFMNSVIQCMSNTRPLLEYLLNEHHMNDINTTTSSMKGALIKAFAQVIRELWESSGDHVVNTTALKAQIQRFAPRFMGYAQQDAQEFLRYLLEGLHEDVNRVAIKPQPILTDIPDHCSDSQKAAESWKRYLRSEDSTIVDVFVGQLRSSLTCTSCDHVSVTLDPFWDLSLPIPTRSGTVKLNQCLEHFTKVETMDGDEKPTCSKCQTRRKCTKSFSIQKFPKILVIHLKRFSPTERFRAKLSVLVDFPLMGLDLGAFAAPSVQGCTYNLYGVANHSGTPYSGHYTAYCKHPYSGEWHEYNDSRVSSVSASSVISSEAYVLFYEQQPLSHHL